MTKKKETWYNALGQQDVKAKTERMLKMRTPRIIDIAGWCGLNDQAIHELVSRYKGFEAIEAITTEHGVPIEEVEWAIDQSYKFLN